MDIHLCKVCGYAAFGNAPENCPVCHAARTSFEQNNNLFTEVAEKNPEGAVKHTPEVQVKKECGLIPEESCTDILVRVGKTLHPMTEEHLIKFVDCYVDDKYVSRISLTPDTHPSVVFHLKGSGKSVKVVEFCNLHGHWQTEASLE